MLQRINRWLRNGQNDKGFTLIELMVVVVIIGILAAIAIPQFSGQKDKAKEGVAYSDMRTIKTALELYYAENGSYPATGTDGTVTNILDDLDDYIANIDTNDPWGAPYKYEKNGNGYNLYSEGSGTRIDAK